MLQTTALANQNKCTLFNGDFARGYASHGLGATSLTVKKGTIKKLPLKAFCAYALQHLPTGTKMLCPMSTLYCPQVFLANEKSIFEFFTQPKFSLSLEPP